MKAIIKTGDILSALCKGAGQWGMYCSGFMPEVDTDDTYGADVEEIKKAAPWFMEISGDERFHLLTEGHVFLLFDTQEEMETLYLRTVGDDGPTELNPYDGPWRIYCLTCDPTGQLRNENT